MQVDLHIEFAKSKYIMSTGNIKGLDAGDSWILVLPRQLAVRGETADG